MQRVTFSVLFYVKRSKPFKNGDLPIYLRITIDGKKAETSLKRGVPPELWDNVRHRAKGQSTEAKQINQELDSVSGQLHNHKLEFQEHGKTLTAQALLNAYLGKGDQQITLCGLFEEHNSDMSARVGKDYAPLTLQQYKAPFPHLIPASRPHRPQLSMMDGSFPTKCTITQVVWRHVWLGRTRWWGMPGIEISRLGGCDCGFDYGRDCGTKFGCFGNCVDVFGYLPTYTFPKWHSHTD